MSLKESQLVADTSTFSHNVTTPQSISLEKPSLQVQQSNSVNNDEKNFNKKPMDASEPISLKSVASSQPAEKPDQSGTENIIKDEDDLFGDAEPNENHNDTSSFTETPSGHLPDIKTSSINDTNTLPTPTTSAPNIVNLSNGTSKPITPPVEEKPSLNLESPAVNPIPTTKAEPSSPAKHTSELKRPLPVVSTTQDLPQKKVKKVSTANTNISSSSPSAAATNFNHTNGKGLAKHQIKFALASIKAVKRLRDAGPFLFPVDIVKLNIPTYFDYVKNPMDLSTMETKLNNGSYSSVKDLASDMELIVSNCELFNGPESQISQMANNIKNSFLKHLKNMPSFEQAPPSGPKPKRKSFSSSATGPKSQRVAAANSVALADPTKPTPSQAASILEAPRPKREIHPPNKDLNYSEPQPRKKGEMAYCANILKVLKSKSLESIAFPFKEPVDPVALGCPDYFEVIKQPMDLSTITKKLQSNEYNTAADFEKDIRLMFKNCYTFNPEGSPVNLMGHRLEAVFDEKWANRPFAPVTPPPQATAATASAASAAAAEASDSEFDSEDQAELSSNPAIKFLEEQLDRMQRELEKMKKEALKELREKRKVKPVKKRPAATSKRPKETGASSGSGPRRKAQSKSTSNNTNSAASNTVASEEVVTYDMKRQLSEAIGTLSEEKMAHVLATIQESMPQLKNTDQDEIELDMDTLDPKTLLKLYKYVVRKEERQSATSTAITANLSSGVANGGSGSSGSTGVKKKSKPLSENEQRQQIQELKKKLEQFDRVENGGSAQMEASSSDDDDDDESSSEEE